MASNGEGTNHFVSKSAADRYYQQYGYENADGQVADGSIVIGEPTIKPGEQLIVIPGEGRYAIQREAERTVVKPKSILDEAQLLSVADDRIVLPEQHLVHYAELKRLLETSGGRYNSKGFFSFPDGVLATEVMAQIRQGKALNGKKESQSFFTPEEEAYAVCRDAGPLEGRRVLEPSAGDGALADVARAAGAKVTVVENYRPNALVLKEKGYDVIEEDFLSLSPDDLGLFDAIVANPPFSNNQDIEHVTHMLKFLKPGGYLSVITSTRWMTGAQKAHREFKSLMDVMGATWEEIDAGAFKASGTMVPTLRIRLQKSEAPATVCSSHALSRGKRATEQAGLTQMALAL